MELEYMEYQEKIMENKKQIVEKFYNALAYHCIDLKGIDKLIIKDVGLFIRYTRIIAIKNDRVVLSVIEREKDLISVLYRQQNMIEEELGLEINRKDSFKREALIPTCIIEWEIDCSNIK